MADFIYFTQEQIERANAVAIADILQRQGEQVERSGSEWRWKRHHSVTLRGNQWYRHSEQTGSHAIDFMQEFFGMNFQEAVTYLLDGETGQAVVKKAQEQQTKKKEVKKPFSLPPKSADMKHVYAYLMKKRFIDREIVSYFASKGTLYEESSHHNAVFVGVDKAGVPRHAHMKGTCSDGKSFRINVEGSNPAYGFGYAGKGKLLYVFEAPIDCLSFLTLYPKGWQENSYITLNGISEHAMVGMLREHPQLDTVVLCLDHDEAGIENTGRLADILKKYDASIHVRQLQPSAKDWNEDLKAENGAVYLPAVEHPKLEECRVWCEVLKKTAEIVSEKYATGEYLRRYHYKMYETLKGGTDVSHLEDAFDGDGLMLSAVAVKIMEKYGREMGYERDTGQIIDNLCSRYRPYKDKGNLKTRLSNLQKAYEDTMESLAASKSQDAEGKKKLVKNCVSLTMECIGAHIFVSEKIQEQTLKAEGGMEQVCSRSSC